jgi:hypothetical protein
MSPLFSPEYIIGLFILIGVLAGLNIVVNQRVFDKRPGETAHLLPRHISQFGRLEA